MTPLSSIFLLFLASAVICALACFPVISFLRKRQVLDRPNERSSHVVPTPRGGGLAIVLVLVPGLLLIWGFTGEAFALLLAICGLLLAGISFIDDLKPLGPAVRFSVHLLAAALFVAGSYFWTSRPLSWSTGAPAINGLWLPVLAFLGCIYLVGYANAFNFMDGINGISGNQAFFSGTGVVLISLWVAPEHLRGVSLAGALLAGCAVGFLPHNFPKARVFMGDVGSVPLGFISAGLALTIGFKHGLWLLVPLVLLHVNYILDTAITLLRRVFRGEKWYQPHREHFYQRLVRSDYSHPFVTGCEAALQGVTLLAVLVYLQASGAGRVAIIAGVLVIWATFFTWAELTFRAAQLRLNQSTGTAGDKKG